MARQDSADTFTTDGQTLHRSESRDNASRLMDDLELLRIEQQVSNEERLEEASKAGRRSSSRQRDRHNPHQEPEDAFHTLTEPLPMTVPPKDEEKHPTFLTKLYKKLRKFPRAVRYILYVGSCSEPPPPFGLTTQRRVPVSAYPAAFSRALN